jgi:tRNA nucleotidyltransferase (CCA-adding enzyme)
MSNHPAQEAHYELFPNGADIRVRGFGITEQAAFEQDALALTGIALEPEKIHEREVVFIHCQAPNQEILLVNWLNSVIHEATSHKMLFGRFRVNGYNRWLHHVLNPHTTLLLGSLP